MKQLGWLVCRTLIEKRKRESKSSLFSFLSPADKEQILNLSPPSQDISQGFDLKKEVLNLIHYSWLVPYLRSLSEKEVCLFLSCLEKTKAEKLKKALKCSIPLIELSKPAKQFFQDKLADFLLAPSDDHFPLEALPKTPLKTLLDLSAEELKLTIELLGLHDLAVELKMIIDTTQLKKIYAVFPKEKELFLKMLAHKKEPVLFRRLEIARWDGKSSSLLPLVYQRGLNRLAKALYPESPHLVWYVKRRMEMEDSEIFASLCKHLEHPKAYSFLSDQVLEALAFVRKINPSVSS